VVAGVSDSSGIAKVPGKANDPSAHQLGVVRA
jgi:hypothetical protein